MKCSHEYNMLNHIVSRRYVSPLKAFQLLSDIKIILKYIALIRTKDLSRIKPVRMRQLPRTCFPKIQCFSFTHLKLSNCFSLIKTQFLPFTNYRTAGEGGRHFFHSSYHFHTLHRHLDISRAVPAESSPLHIGSSRTRTRNLRSLSTSGYPFEE